MIGGGLPLAAVGGNAAVMDQLAPLGPVYQAGTLSGNPLATAAGLAVLTELDDAAFARLEQTAEHLAEGFRKAFADAGLAAQVTRAFTLLGVFFADAPVVDFAGAQRADHARYSRFFHALLDAGVFVAPSGYETLFPSLAHDGADVDATIAAVSTAAALAAALSRGLLVALFAPAPHVIHVEQRAGEQEHHDGERDERGTAVLARIDELLCEKHAGLLRRRDRDRCERGTLALAFVLLPPVQAEQRHAEDHERRQPVRHDREPDRAVVVAQHRESRRLERIARRRDHVVTRGVLPRDAELNHCVLRVVPEEVLVGTADEIRGGAGEARAGSRSSPRSL